MSIEIQEGLKKFGLTGQEAAIYEALLKYGEMTGYEMAKETGISRSYVYGALASLVDKGAAYLIEGDVARYVPVEMSKFCENTLHDLNEQARFLIAHAPKRVESYEGYITIQGTAHIHNKLHEMLDKCDKRVYFMAEEKTIREYETQLIKLISEGKKVVLLTSGYELEGAVIYDTPIDSYQLRVITDSSYVLTGTYGDLNNDTCLYSGQPNLVAVMKEALGNRISLIEMEEKEK